MRTPNFRFIVRRLPLLSSQQRDHLCVHLSRLVARDWAADVIDRARLPRICCPHCGSTSLYRHGIVDQLQRYRCRSCKRTFNALTGTPLARLRHRARWRDFIDCMLDPASTVRGSAKRSGIHKNTSFRWRHRFLNWARLDRPRTLQGIAEADETFLPESQKGSRMLTRRARTRGGRATRRGISEEQVCIVVARDRARQTIDFIAGRGALTKHALMQNLLPAIDRDILLVTDANPAYRAFSNATGIAHESINLPRQVGVNGAIHIQNVNAYHSRFKGWLRHFNGVATRYLDNYLGWRWALDGSRIRQPERFLQIAIGVFHT